MNVALFCHSIRSDWNNGHVHFLRGVVTELQHRGAHVAIYEPADAWSATCLAAGAGAEALHAYRAAYPNIDPVVYAPGGMDLDAAVHDADLVIVHEWTDAALVRALGARRLRGARFLLLFHDMHHRSASDAAGVGALDLSGYDGVLAFGEAVRERFVRQGWSQRVWTWHEAADTRVFHPRRPPAAALQSDIVWVGNWGDEERTAELNEFLLGPARTLGLTGHVHGVRYPTAGTRAVTAAGLVFAGRVANHDVPDVFAAHRVTVHVPRGPYVTMLPGIPTIRVFEALACGIPLVCAPWDDVEGLFLAGDDYLVARNRDEMTACLRDVLHDPALAAHLRRHGLQTIARGHTCAHRVDQLLQIVATLRTPAPATA